MSPILLAIFSLLFLLGGVYLLYSVLRRKLTCKTPAAATITDLKRNSSTSSRRRRSTYTPICEFRADGQTVTAESFLSSKAGKYRAGDRVEILYNEENPKLILIEGQSVVSMLLSGILLLVLGGCGLFLTISAALALIAK